MKQVIRLTESDLHRIVKESVKRILRETSYRHLGYDEQGYGPVSYNNDRNIEVDNNEVDDMCYDDFLNMASKLKGKDRGGQLDKLIRKNPIYRKWYDKMHKKNQMDASWNALADHDEAAWDDYVSAMRGGLGDHDANMNVHPDSRLHDDMINLRR